MKQSTNIILTALFAALICAGAFITVPLPGGVPLALQDMLSMLTGLLLGPVYGCVSVLVFLVLGAVGLPVFTGKGGLHILLQGPTCGFLWGYLVSAIVGGLFLKFALPLEKQHSAKKQFLFIAIAAVLETLVLFALGITGFCLVTKATVAKSLSVTVIPFIPGNILKIVLMTLLTKKFRPVIYNYTH